MLRWSEAYTSVFGVFVLVYSALFITVSKKLIARRNESFFRVRHNALQCMILGRIACPSSEGLSESFKEMVF